MGSELFEGVHYYVVEENVKSSVAVSCKTISTVVKSLFWVTGGDKLWVGR